MSTWVINNLTKLLHPAWQATKKTQTADRPPHTHTLTHSYMENIRCLVEIF